MAHLSGIGIENFRVFGDLTWFDLKPITILTGPNSSGKSSFNKLLLLLHENFSKSKIFKELDFTSQRHHLGNFKNVLSDSKNESIIIQIPIILLFSVAEDTEKWIMELTFVNREQLKENADLGEIRIFNPKTKDVLLSLKFTGEMVLDHEAITIPPLKSFKVIPQVNLNLFFKKMTNIKLKDEIERRKKVHVFRNITMPPDPGDTKAPRGIDTLMTDFSEKKVGLGINKFDYEIELNLPYFDQLINLMKFGSSLSEVEFDKIANEVVKKAIDAISSGLCSFKHDPEFIEWWSGMDPFWRFKGNNFYYDREKDDHIFTPIVKDNYIPVWKLNSLFNSLQIFEPLFYEVIYHLWKNDYTKQIFADYKTYEVSTGDIFEERRKDFVPEPIVAIEKALGYLLDRAFKYLHDCLKNDNLYYLPSMRSATARIFMRSTNLSLFEETIKEYYELEHEFSKIEKSFLKSWLKKFSIADDLIIERIENTVSVAYLKRGKEKINIADLGFGTTQLLPILMKIVVIARKNIMDEDSPEEILYHNSICIIEEPESNLHPNFESLLADMLVDAAHRFSIQFIIETHSEYLIRKLQYLTAKGKVNTGASVIYYFNAENVKGKERVKKIEIKEDGRLTSEFGPGFYDEATRLMMSMFTDENDN